MPVLRRIRSLTRWQIFLATALLAWGDLTLQSPPAPERLQDLAKDPFWVSHNAKAGQVLGANDRHGGYAAGAS